jgi:protein-ribulosamine 3-kinase
MGVGGGCIAAAGMATFADGSSVFVKSSRRGQGAPPADMFPCEAEGLETLAAAGAIRVPAVLAVNARTLVLEAIAQAPRKKGFAEDFGRGLARLHAQRGKACGFARDNFIGASRQYNQPIGGCWAEAEDPDGSRWPEFFLQRRLRAQVRLAAGSACGSELAQLLDRAEAAIGDMLSAAREPPGLLHGDLWSGNFIVDERGEACLIDPAVYYGHRETDLAMTRLFGGFEPAFYAAYGEAMPLAPGHQDRLQIYQLYHLLNHLNLFGGSYFGQSRRILQHYARR